MDLILWRHAEAVQGGVSFDEDLARPLTPKGERHADRVGRWLNQAMPASARILVSPALRTQQTAKALDRRFKTCAALAPGGSVQGLLEAARWPDSREPVLIVGHQPTLGRTLAHLLAGLPADAAPSWRIRKAGVWWLRRRDDGEPPLEITVLTVRSPEMP